MSKQAKQALSFLQLGLSDEATTALEAVCQESSDKEVILAAKHMMAFLRIEDSDWQGALTRLEDCNDLSSNFIKLAAYSALRADDHTAHGKAVAMLERMGPKKLGVGRYRRLLKRFKDTQSSGTLRLRRNALRIDTFGTGTEIARVPKRSEGEYVRQTAIEGVVEVTSKVEARNDLNAGFDALKADDAELAKPMSRKSVQLLAQVAELRANQQRASRCFAALGCPSHADFQSSNLPTPDFALPIPTMAIPSQAERPQASQSALGDSPRRAYKKTLHLVEPQNAAQATNDPIALAWEILRDLPTAHGAG